MDMNFFREINKHQELPLARIKKIMKIDDDVKNQMISAEAPVLLAKAAEFLIEELTLRAWIHTEENRRKTIQKSDIAQAVSKNEVFDFLIDIVPRDEIMKSRSVPHNNTSTNETEEYYQLQTEAEAETSNGQSVQYILQYANNDSDTTNLSNSMLHLANGQVIQATQIGPSIPLSGTPGQSIQVMTVGNGERIEIIPVSSSNE
uniref:Transcription factor CBF/NF-Y/archaeal histone domain-containing protein n=1 Tax=Acrobeloides nanus TaxID=290746 RepID=A0A914C556_9BILA